MKKTAPTRCFAVSMLDRHLFIRLGESSSKLAVLFQDVFIGTSLELRRILCKTEG